MRATEQELIKKHLEDLYASNRGALYSNSLIQAQVAFEKKEYSRTLELVKSSRELFERRHQKTLHGDPQRPDGKSNTSKKDRLAFQSKQAKAIETLGMFDDVLKSLEKMAKLQRAAAPRREAESETPGATQATSQLPEGFREEYEAAGNTDARYQVICRHFGVELVGSAEEIIPAALYYVRGKECHLVRISRGEPGADVVPLTLVLSGRRMKPVARAKLLELGLSAKLLRLKPKTAGVDSTSSNDEQDSEAPDIPIGPKQNRPDSVIDMGTFTQLVSAARQSGVVPGADQIAHVRDREFRMGQFQTAFNIIDRLFVKLAQAATQRKQRLLTEEVKYKSGVLKMSPKEWQLKKQRDTLQTDKIERARRMFTRVLDGLRISILARNKSAGRGSSEES